MDVDVKIVDGAAAVAAGEVTAATLGGTLATIEGDGTVVFITTEEEAAVAAAATEVKPEQPEVKDEPVPEPPVEVDVAEVSRKLDAMVKKISTSEHIR